MNEPLIGRSSATGIDVDVSAAAGSAISWEDLAAIRKQPWDSAINTALTFTNVIADELTKASHVFDTVLVATAVDHGRDPAACKRLAQRLPDKHFILGTTPTAKKSQKDGDDPVIGQSSQSIEASKDDMDRMEQELTSGYPVKPTTTAAACNHQSEPELIRAGFIGELHLSPNVSDPELRQLRACAVVQASTGAPFLLAVSKLDQVTSVLKELEVCGADLPKIIWTHMDVLWKNSNNNATQIPQQIQSVLEMGGNICLDRFSISSAIWDLDHTLPCFREVAAMIQTLLTHNAAWCSQVFLSSGVCMRLQYQRYGGMGYGVITDHLIPRLSEQGLTKKQINTMIKENPTRLLCWWTSPPPLERPKEYLPCSVCKRMFEPILGEYYSKYRYTYCGTTCLREHRKMGFKEL
jgi:predicted metal-dependent phosphotriesterase family hydrolase